MWCSERRALLRRLAALPVAAAAAACGFQPVYAPGTPAAGLSGRLAVDPIDGAAGFALQERLVERLGAAVVPSHRIAVDLVISRESAAITRDNITTRFNVLGAATFRVFDPARPEPVLAETVQARTGYSAPAGDTASAFASRAAGRDAEERLARHLADRIVMRLALTAGDWAA